MSVARRTGPRGFLVCLLLMCFFQPAQDCRAGVDERLVDQFGHRLGASDLNGHWLLVYFGYASCPDACPAALMRMTLALRQLKSTGDVIVPLFVSVDPAHDTPARLRDYVAAFHPRLRALSGSEAAVRDAASSFGVPVRTRGGVDHGLLIYVVAPDGRVVQTFHPRQPVAEIVAALRGRLAGEPRS